MAEALEEARYADGTLLHYTAESLSHKPQFFTFHIISNNMPGGL
jgi:hypothetical protein